MTKAERTMRRAPPCSAAVGRFIDKASTRVHNGQMLRSARGMLAATALLWALPAVTANAALERAQFEAALMTARDYADDRSLVFYCLRRVREQVPFLYAGLQSELEQTVVKMKVAGASARQTAEVVQAVLSQVRFFGRDARDESLERRCIAKDVERSRAEARGVSLPLFLRPPFDRMGK